MSIFMMTVNALSPFGVTDINTLDRHCVLNPDAIDDQWACEKPLNGMRLTVSCHAANR